MAYREFRDSSGALWRTWDTRPNTAANVRTRFADGWVCFESERERRRLEPIPDGWTEATEDELWEWLARAEPAPRLAEGGLLAVARVPAGVAGAPALPASSPVLLERTRSAVVRARAVIAAIDTALGTPPAPGRGDAA